MHSYKSMLRLITLLGILIPSGCGEQKSDLPKCYPVSGRVLVDGKPAVRAVVSFHPQAKQADGKEYVGQTLTGDNGEFWMTTFTAGDGIPSGEYVVTIKANWISRNGQDVGVPDLLKGRYADPETSSLKVTVKTEPVVLEPFDLESPSK